MAGKCQALPVSAHLAGCNPCLCFQFLQLCLLAAPLHGCHLLLVELCHEKLCRECSAGSPARAPSEPLETPGQKGALPV